MIDILKRIILIIKHIAEKPSEDARLFSLTEH